MRELHISQTWIFYYPMTRPPLSSPWSTGDAASSPPRAGCQCPSPCQLSASSPLCCQDGGRRLLRDGKHKTGPPQWVFDDTLQLGFSNSISLLSECYMGKDALPAGITICSPQCTRKAASNQSSLTFLLVLLKWFRISGCWYFSFLKEIRGRT